ncbi:hypothetical protein ORF116R [Spotted knifejaw iridovirus]|uniref:ORF118R n=1 Tax=Giant seaperch iridovirus TaxID=176655 RepID=A0A140GBA0_GSIV|nr:ORF118R [giant sea perch iridovirus - K1]WBR81592.1 hypothetical protein ORF116R [Spotted knifejaw iridovirus]
MSAILMSGRVLQIQWSLNMGMISLVSFPEHHKSRAKKLSLPVMLLSGPGLMVSSLLGSSITAQRTPLRNLANSGLALVTHGLRPVSTVVLIFTAKLPSIFSNMVCVTVLPLLPLPVQKRHTLSALPPTNTWLTCLRKYSRTSGSGNVVL